MGFIRLQEERFAAKLLAIKYQRMNLPVPDQEALMKSAAAIVEQAHRIARERGKSMGSILKDLVADLKK